ncbi:MULTISPECIES: response regulator transcription factor [unclassified Rathayibacter]|uniref:response regulator transcription factor n=1 Tax=unclassified Rathayibacter TaxID=2609250 RepID=UPI00188D9E3F|nr:MULTISPECIES: response regulator transcription factor [unclassified Rathayibacter]MBF4463206.1 response regulator transcription factor [Rathayibacter sp. VKM Ac-2879]MBF4504557.1 response regulator transcription factor [Rathayibacter sp. VKM Ac-2878]
MIRVAVADDHLLFCSGLQMLIDAEPDLDFAGAAYQGSAAVALALRERPDVLLLDVRMPVLDGISATRHLTQNPTNTTRVVILTTHQHDSAVAEALAAGAAGFLMKDASTELLLGTIRAVAAGRTIIAGAGNRSPVRDYISTSATSTPEVLAVLSAKEREIFAAAAQGRSIAELAAQAHLSESTIKSHISSILSKLGLASRLQLVAFAHQHGLA